MIELIKHEISTTQFIGKTTASDDCGPVWPQDLMVTNITGPGAIFHQNDHSPSQSQLTNYTFNIF